MGKYSIRGSDAFDARLDQDFARVARALEQSPDRAQLRALVLLGGYGRGEGTPRIVEGRQEPFNDYDFVVVSAPMGRRRSQALQGRLRLLEQRLSAELGLPIDLQLYTDGGLRRAEFSLLNYEMKYGHQVVWGDPNALAAMPAYPCGRVPLSEGTRLLLNRGKLLLDVRRALREGRELSADERLRFVKFLYKAMLAFGDCALLASHAYDLSYAVKKARIAERLAPGVPDAPFLIERYRAAVALKDWGDYSFLPAYPLADEFERIRKYYLRFLPWYEAARAQAAQVSALSASPDDAPAWKKVAYNAQAFGVGALSTGAALWTEHPRVRLYRALPLLLADEPVDAAAVARQFLMPAASREAAEDRFYQLQRRFS